MDKWEKRVVVLTFSTRFRAAPAIVSKINTTLLE